MPDKNNQGENEQEIKDLRERLTYALHTKDSKSVIKHFAEESVMFLLVPPLQFKTGEKILLI